MEADGLLGDNFRAKTVLRAAWGDEGNSVAFSLEKVQKS